MPRSSFSPREVASALDNKVCDETGSRGEVNCWVIVDGKRLFRVTRPQVHGRDAVAPGTLNSIRNQTRLSKEEFGRLVDCSMSRADYHDLIRRKRDAGQI